MPACVAGAGIDEVDRFGIQKHMPRRWAARGQRSLQPVVEVTDTRKEQVAARAPNQSPGNVTRLGVEPDVAIRFRARQLAQHRALRVAGPINQQQQRQPTPRAMPCRTPNVSSPAMTTRRNGELPGPREQVTQIARPRKVEHCGDDDRSECRVRQAAEQGRQENKREEAKDCGKEVGELGASPAAMATDVLDRLPTTRNPPKRPLRILPGPWATSSWFGSMSPPSCIAAAFAPPSASA